MLIQKPIAENDIVTLKLITGEEVLAGYISNDADHYTVKKPATIANNGQGGMGIIPWMMTSKAETVKITSTTVIAMAPTDDDIAKAYTEATSSIQLV